MAVRLGVAAGLRNAATCEFLLDPDGRFWFLEVNTRLQVEHGVTELVAGVDIVREQFLVAAARRWATTSSRPANAPPCRQGHAIEVRIAAEDPSRAFAPTPGRVGRWVMPSGPGVRVDTAIESGDACRPTTTTSSRSCMVHAHDRDAAIDRLRRALDETEIGGDPDHAAVPPVRRAQRRVPARRPVDGLGGRALGRRGRAPRRRSRWRCSPPGLGGARRVGERHRRRAPVDVRDASDDARPRRDAATAGAATDDRTADRWRLTRGPKRAARRRRRSTAWPAMTPAVAPAAAGVRAQASPATRGRVGRAHRAADDPTIGGCPCAKTGPRGRGAVGHPAPGPGRRTPRPRGRQRRRSRVVLEPPRRDGRGASGVREVLVDGFRFEVEVEPERRAALRERATRRRPAGDAGGPREVRAVIPGKVVAVAVGPTATRSRPASSCWSSRR